VQLFSGYELRALTITGAALRVGAALDWYAGNTLSISAGSTPLLDSRALPAVGALRVLADSPLQVSATIGSEAALVRRYAGELVLRLGSGAITCVNAVPVEDYVASTLVSEASPSWSLEALRAQAIAVRTFGIQAAAAAARGVHDYDLRDDTSSQVYHGLGNISGAFLSACATTQQQVVSWRGEPAKVFYSATCGGHTASVAEIGGLDVPAYLAGIADTDAAARAYCAAAPYFQWKNALAAGDLARVVEIPAGSLAGCSVSDRWPDGRVKTLSVQRSDGEAISVAGRSFYSRCLQVLGYKVVPSTFFDIRESNGTYVLTGHGIGHGVGMCQWGARGRADAGQKAEEILQAYFPGTAIQAMSLR